MIFKEMAMTTLSKKASMDRSSLNNLDEQCCDELDIDVILCLWEPNMSFIGSFRVLYFHIKRSTHLLDC